MSFSIKLSPHLKNIQHESARLFVFTECRHSPQIGDHDLDEVAGHREDISHLEEHDTWSLGKISNLAQRLTSLGSQRQ